MGDSLCGRYSVEYADDIEKGTIYMFNRELQNQILLPQIETAKTDVDPLTNENFMCEISLKVIGEEDREEFIEYLKNQVARIEIKNYGDN
jgi:hypothetical protein